MPNEMDGTTEELVERTTLSPMPTMYWESTHVRDGTEHKTTTTPIRDTPCHLT